MNEEYRKVEIEEASERLGMGNDFIERLIKKFLESDMLDNASQAFASANVADAKIAIHTIKGAAANIGLTGLSKLALDIETPIKEREYLDLDLFNLMKRVWGELMETFRVN